MDREQKELSFPVRSLCFEDLLLSLMVLLGDQSESRSIQTSKHHIAGR
jgi:hypothetical protein